MTKSQKIVAHPTTERSVLQKTMEELRTIDDLVHTVHDYGNVQLLVAAIHRAVVDTVPHLLEVKLNDDRTTVAELEETLRYAIARGTAFVALMMSWPRDEGGHNPALAAVLDAMEFKEERHPTVGWEIVL